MKRPRKALVLAAGFGTRMRPLSHDCPKPLMPVWGVPNIEHLIGLLRSWGVHDILVNLHHQPDRVLSHFRDRDNRDVKVQLSFEPEILGTGGALRRADWFIDNQPFWMINTDVAADVSPAPLLRAYETRRPLAAVWLDPAHGPRTVETFRGCVSAFRSHEPGVPGTATFCGLHLISPDILKWVPDRGFGGIVEAYEKAMARGRRVAGVIVPGSFWRDLGTPDQYIAAHRDIRNAFKKNQPGSRLYDPIHEKRMRFLRREGVQLTGFAAIGKDTVIEAGARISDSVVWSGARIGRRVVLHRAIVSSGVTVNTTAVGPVVRAACSPDPALTEALKALRWQTGAVTVMPLSARGSDRSFTRVAKGSKSAIVVAYGTERKENTRHAGHARFLLKHGIPVPRVLADLPRQRLLVVEDVGNESLLSMVLRNRPTPTPCGRLPLRGGDPHSAQKSGRRSPPGRGVRLRRAGWVHLERCYRQALDALLALHHIPVATGKRLKLEPAFTASVYRWERELMATHLLKKTLGLRAREILPAMEDLETVAARLVKVPRGLVHRDMQSSNILWHKGKPVIVDFQGMRFGPAAYDVASLLCDPYVMLPMDLQSRLLEYYLAGSRNPATVRDVFWRAAVERLAQALGAYGRLGQRPGTRQFTAYIQPALTMMERALGHLEGLEALKGLIAALRKR